MSSKFSPQLRHEAEARLAHSPGEGPFSHSAEELLHELRVHQIELEMQNEELRRAQLALEESRDRYVDLYEFAPVGYLTLNLAGRVAEINLAGASLIGVERAKLLHRRFDHCVVLEDRDRWQLQFHRVMGQPSGKEGIELMLQRGEGSSVDVHLDCLRVEATPPTLRMAMTDISAMKLNQRLLAAKEALHEQLLFQSALLESIPVPVYYKDVEGRCQGCNRAFEEILGRTRTEIIGRSGLNQALPEVVLQREVAGAALSRSPGDRVFESVIQTTSGIMRDVLFYKSNVLRGDGTAGGEIGVLVDITQRKQIESELEQHRSHLEALVQERSRRLMETEARASHILNASADGLYGVDAEGRITFINPAACALLGYASEQILGRFAHSLFHHSKPDGSPYPFVECPTHNALRLGQDAPIDNEVYWHAEGHEVPVMCATHPMVRDGLVVGAVTSLVDVSAQRAAAQAREQALQAAENLARLRREFLANVSHEIRTPLNGVLGFAEIGVRNFQYPEKALNAFNQILGSGKRLLRVINDILDFSNIEAGKLRIEKTETILTDVVSQAVENVGAAAQAKGLALRVNLDPELPQTCLGDPQRLGQVLLNLLSNAVKFTQTGSVSLSLSRQGDKLVFKVADTGIGMDAEQLSQVFDPFLQADGSTTRKFGGTGLGLAIAKRVLELMGGGIRVESRLGVGSLFEFTVPCVHSPCRVEPARDSGGDKPTSDFPTQPGI